MLGGQGSNGFSFSSSSLVLMDTESSSGSLSIASMPDDWRAAISCCRVANKVKALVCFECSCDITILWSFF